MAVSGVEEVGASPACINAVAAETETAALTPTPSQPQPPSIMEAPATKTRRMRSWWHLFPRRNEIY